MNSLLGLCERARRSIDFGGKFIGPGQWYIWSVAILLMQCVETVSVLAKEKKIPIVLLCGVKITQSDFQRGRIGFVHNHLVNVCNTVIGTEILP
jgi:hypothetical protein